MWEYKTVTLQMYTILNLQPLAMYGDHGWEFIYAHSGGVDTQVFHFKRKKD